MARWRMVGVVVWAILFSGWVAWEALAQPGTVPAWLYGVVGFLVLMVLFLAVFPVRVSRGSR